MLSVLRKQIRSPYMQGILLIIILVFVFWGVDMTGNQRMTAATVNNIDITHQEYRRLYQEKMSMLREQFGGVIPRNLLEIMDIQGQTINQLIQQVLLRQGAAQVGLTVSAAEVISTIQGMEAFRVDGIFNLARYQDVLTMSRLSVSDFEAGIKSDLLNRKIGTHLSRFAHVTHGELKERFVDNNKKIRVEYVVFDSFAFSRQIEPSDDQLMAFFDIYKSNYNTPVQVRLKYIFFPLNEKDKNTVFKKARTAYEQIILAGSLEKYMAATGVTVNKTDYFNRQAPPLKLMDRPRAIEAAFKLREGELSSLVFDNSGYSILYMEDIREPETPPLAAVKGQVTQDFIAQQSHIMAREAAEVLLSTLADEGSWQEEIQKLGQEINSSGFFSQVDLAAANIPEQLINAGFMLSSEELYTKSPVEINNNFYLLRLAAIKEPEGALFAAQQESLRDQLAEENQMQLLASWLEYLRSEADITINRELL